MGCKKLTYYESQSPLKVVYRKTGPQQKVAQRWLRVDPLFEKYPSMSPYNYCANNPIMLIDPDGRDWDIAINHDTRTITISAGYVAFGDNATTIQVSADAWNAQSGKFSYVIGKGDEAISYTVNFELTVNAVEESYNTGSVLPNDHARFQERTEEDASGNEIIIRPQGVADGRNFAVKESESKDVSITSHEMGHTLGMGHSSGLMRKTAGGKKLAKESASQTLRRSGVGRPMRNQSSARMRNRSETGETPVDFNQGKLKKNDNWQEAEFE